MQGFYPYIMSSLPMLQFGAKPPFGPGRFLEQCAGMVTEQELETLKQCFSPSLLDSGVRQPALRAWISFETGLRNELVKIRAARKKTDPNKFLRPGGRSDQGLYHAAMSAHRIQSVSASEKFIDAERWKALDEISAGHYFDLDALVIYALKLRILSRWEQIEKTDKLQLLEKTLAGT